MAACLGPLCGRRFPDELSDEESEEEDEERKSSKANMTAKKMTKKARSIRRERLKDDAKASGNAALKWTQYMNQVSMKVRVHGVDTTTKVVELRVKDNSNLTPAMMSSINQLAKVHTVELINCHREDIPPYLNELDLRVLRMSKNQLSKFSEDLPRCRLLEQLILDRNYLRDISPGIFSRHAFGCLEVLCLAHNSLHHLPSDFGLTASRRSLRLVDLSNNTIQSIPESLIKGCLDLEELNLSNNKLKFLPDKFELKKLQKLFLSFNALTRLPSGLGSCVSLAKLRIVDNSIHELPASILALWRKRGGKLEELLVSRNPLVLPSYTAFEMEDGSGLSGIDRAFGLFEATLEERRLAEEATAHRALEEAKAALEAAERGQQQRQRLALSNASRENSVESGRFPLQDDDARFASLSQASETAGSGYSAGIIAMDYYYAHCLTKDHEPDLDMINGIRNVESVMLVLKRNKFVDSQRALALQQRAESLPESMRLFLQDDYRDRFKGVVPVKDLDLYFNLLVYSMKPLFCTMALLFDKYEVGNKGFMTWAEWQELCLCVPVELSEVVRQQVWELMAYKNKETVTLNDFAAAWHIHDVEARDPWIARLAQALKLDYYDMTIAELNTRLQAKDAQDATPRLDFDNAVDTEGLGEEGQAVAQLADVGGLRRSRPRSKERPGEADDEAAPGAGAGGLSNLVSLSEAQYELYKKEEADAASGSEAASYDNSVSSRGLSEERSDSDAEPFAAFDVLVTLEGQRRARAASAGLDCVGLLRELALRGPVRAPALDEATRQRGDEELRRLMEMPVDEVLQSRDALERIRAAAELKARPKKPPEKRRPPRQRPEASDPRFKTDVFPVRQALRQVYRNMPFRDFLSLVNFLLRGMQLMKHSQHGFGGRSVSFWHADDPTFSHTVGLGATNKYTRGLLVQMGFVLLNDLYWVWPSIHLESTGPPYVAPGGPTTISWGEDAVPSVCPGRDTNRLDDMIWLLRSCRMSLHKSGTAFRGHFNVDAGRKNH